MQKLKKYKPSKFMAKKSEYDEEKADCAVNFWSSSARLKIFGNMVWKTFDLIDWEKIKSRLSVTCSDNKNRGLPTI